MDDKRSRTLVQTANAVILLPNPVIDVIGEVCNLEYADISLSNTIKNKCSARKRSEIMNFIYYGVSLNMLNITPLNLSRQFMNAPGYDGES